MVSPLWSACSEGNIDAVLSLLSQASPADIEIKDHTGATPLLEAVKKGHGDVVKALLDKGADPSVASLQGGIEAFTSNSDIIDLLNSASAKTTSYEGQAQDTSFPQDPNPDPSKRYYPIPAHPYGYYPPVPPLADGHPPYYQHPPMPVGENGGFGNLPPPEVARYIPCRYYPACRYGSTCIFAHPQGPYYTGPPPPPPTQYPSPYDPMAQQQYPHNYYPPPPPPPSYPPSAPVPPHMNAMSPPSGPVHTPPHPPIVHARSGSEALSPVQTPFSPNGAPPAPYGALSPVSPYPPPPHPLPLSIPSLPPPHQPATARGPQSPQSMYANGPVSAPPFSVRQDLASYPSQGLHPNSAYPDVNGGPKSSSAHPQRDNYGPPPAFRGVNHRRGGIRRGSFGGNRKPIPPCLFYPAGRCRNGDDCRFPHVISDTPAPQSHLSGYPPRPREVSNDISTIEENFATMTVQESQPRRNGTANSSRSQSTDPGSRSKGSKSIGSRADKKPVLKQQRVPNADEFPVLGGSASSRYLVNGGPAINGSAGPTAAQVLQAPPPVRKDSAKESTAHSTSTEERQLKTQVENRQVECNGIHTNGSIPAKLPVSFAAAATGVIDVVKEISVPA
ncbi:hypothetical protein J3A83DRAFT_4372942 [Scleroderma citrinum]